MKALIGVVLYSGKERLWKIIDFGISSEATSGHAVTSRYARGTAGYRAPELLKEDALYTNKVDIWALGCILVESATGERPFPSDYAIQTYSSEKTSIEMPQMSRVSPTFQPHLREMTGELLHWNPAERPRASTLVSLFQSYLIIGHFLEGKSNYDPSQLQLPSYHKWKDMVDGCPEQREFLVRYASWLQVGTNGDDEIRACEELLYQYPIDNWFVRRLGEAYAKTMDGWAEIERWGRHIRSHPSSVQIKHGFTMSCGRAGREVTVATLRALVMGFPEDLYFASSYANAVFDVGRTTGSRSDIILILNKLYEEQPDNTELEYKLRLSLEWESLEDNPNLLTIWKKLALTFMSREASCREVSNGEAKPVIAVHQSLDIPLHVWIRLIVMDIDNGNLLKGFHNAVSKQGRTIQITTWIQLIEMLPEDTLRWWLKNNLPDTVFIQTAAWKWMVENLFDEDYLNELKYCLERCSVITRVGIWTELLANHPDFLKRCSLITRVEVCTELLTSHPDFLKGCNSAARVEVWTELLANHSDFLTRCSTLTRVEVCTELLANHPDFLKRCNSATRVEVCTELLASHPDFLKTCNPATRVEVWTELLANHPDFLTRCSTLTRVEICTELLANHPDFLKRCSTITRVEVCTELLANHPDSQVYKDKLRKALGYFEMSIRKWLEEMNVLYEEQPDNIELEYKLRVSLEWESLEDNPNLLTMWKRLALTFISREISCPEITNDDESKSVITVDQNLNIPLHVWIRLIVMDIDNGNLLKGFHKTMSKQERTIQITTWIQLIEMLPEDTLRWWLKNNLPETVVI